MFSILYLLLCSIIAFFGNNSMVAASPDPSSLRRVWLNLLKLQGDCDFGQNKCWKYMEQPYAYFLGTWGQLQTQVQHIMGASDLFSDSTLNKHHSTALNCKRELKSPLAYLMMPSNPFSFTNTLAPTLKERSSESAIFLFFSRALEWNQTMRQFRSAWHGTMTPKTAAATHMRT